MIERLTDFKFKLISKFIFHLRLHHELKYTFDLTSNL